MDCAKSLELLSEFRDGALDEAGRMEVKTHLTLCGPCADVFDDLDSIVLAATALRSSEQEIAFPDERVIWQRMNFAGRTIH
jgi:anti-sigma factor ChrR (cupin superfamily)